MSTIVTRRRALSSLALLFCGLRESLADQLAREDHRDFFSNDIPDLVRLGTTPALAEEVAWADRLLAKSPEGVGPYEVLSYLEGLKDTNQDGESYNGGWRDRWNPLIVRFFEQTHTKPSGDATPWCAAALNWALARSGWKTTRSASSGRFRGSPGLTDRPQKGDIVVFASTDPEEAKVGRGHVGVFVERSDRQVLVLGGNQKNNAGHHVICRKLLDINGDKLDLHSFHAADAFRLKA